MMKKIPCDAANRIDRTPRSQPWIRSRNNGPASGVRLLSTPEVAFMIAPRVLCSPDAMGAQRNIVVEIMAPGDECISPLRGNQDRLHDESHDHFDFTLCQFATTMLDPLRRSASRTENNWQYRCRRRSACWSATIWNGCQQMHGYIRSYWSIEKHCHWVLGARLRSLGFSTTWLSPVCFLIFHNPPVRSIRVGCASCYKSVGSLP